MEKCVFPDGWNLLRFQNQSDDLHKNWSGIKCALNEISMAAFKNYELK